MKQWIVAGLLLVVIVITGCSNKGVEMPAAPAKINTTDIMSEQDLLKQQQQKK